MLQAFATRGFFAQSIQDGNAAGLLVNQDLVHYAIF
jgi:hypothetical protein